MSISRTALSLWRRALPWRIVAVGAVASTAMVVISAVMPTGPSSGGPPSGAQNQSQQPPPQQSSPTGGGSQGNAVVHVPRAVEPPDSTSRWIQFTSLVASAQGDQRPLEVCARMRGALDKLEQADHQWANANQDRMAALEKATKCRLDLAASDARLEALTRAHERLREDDSPTAVERLRNARNDLIPSDLARENSPEIRDAVRAGDDAVAAIARSDERLNALRRTVAASPPGSAAALASLAAAAQAIERFDRLRMTPTDVASYEAGQQASETIEKSDRRLAEVASALASARASGAAQPRQALIDAATGLQPLDAERASPEQRAMIGEARGLAASYAMERLVAAVQTFDPESSDPVLFEQLASMKRLIDQSGGQAAGAQPGPEEQAALRTAALAIARLEDSDRSLRRLVAAAEAWKRNPGSAQRAGVEEAHQSLLTPFDRKRLSGETLKAYETVRTAYAIVRARNEGLTPSNKGVVPIFVSADASADRSAAAAGALRSMLARNGYSVVDRLEDAAIHMTVAAPQVEPSSIRIGDRTYDGAVVSLALAARWTYENEVYMHLDGTGRAVGRTVGVAAVEAIEAAATNVIATLEGRVRGNGGGQ